ncbi:MAG TPA: hypothetical protein VIY51_16215 [Xanthobacteraceae bacterium]
MRRSLTQAEKLDIIEGAWTKARARNPQVTIRVHLEDETDESGKPQVKVVIASERRVPQG